MEVIKFGLVGKEDIKVGRSSFEVTLADGRVVQLTELNLDSFDKLLSEDDSSASSTTTALTLRHTTSGTPAAGLGTGLKIEGESADEVPSDAALLEAVFDDVTAGSEDTSFWIQLRRAGSALARKFGFTNTGAFYTLFTTAPTANRTITIPDATTTMVGTDVTQTLSSKTLTDPSINAGSGSGTFLPFGFVNKGTGSGTTTAVTSEEDLLTYDLPANSLSATGKGIYILAAGSTGANANTKTIRLYFGSTVLMSNDLSTVPNNTSWVLEAWLFRNGTTAQEYIAKGLVGSANQTAAYGGAGETVTGAITIKVAGQNGAASAGDITAQILAVGFVG